MKPSKPPLYEEGGFSLRWGRAGNARPYEFYRSSGG